MNSDTPPDKTPPSQPDRSDPDPFEPDPSDSEPTHPEPTHPDTTGSAERRLGLYMMIGFWVIVLGFGTFGAQRWFERTQNRNASVTTAVIEGRRSVELVGDRWGHYSVTVELNGEPVRALVDTGATDISIPQPIAEKIGLRPGREVQVITANGIALVRETRLDSVALGDLISRNVSASINPHLLGEEILLGMSFLRDFDMSIRGDRLTLTER